MAVHRFDRTHLPATAWKNGGGITHEIVCQPAGADMDRFNWRISIAHLASDGPFSTFPGVDRIITLLEGEGMHLFTADRTIDHRLRQPLQAFAFAGEAQVQSRLLGGHCHDFNVMTRRDHCRAQLQVGRGPATLATTSAAGLILAIRGHWQLDDAAWAGCTLAPQQGLWWHDELLHWQLQTHEPDAAVLAVAIYPV